MDNKRNSGNTIYRGKHTSIVDVNPILKNLWLGNIGAAFNTEFLKKNNIKLVVTCMDDNLEIDYNILQISNIKLPIVDADIKTLNNKHAIIFSENILDLCNIIRAFLNNNLGVLVHCFRGVQRSAAVVLAYLLFTKKFTLNGGINHILKCRPKCFNYGSNCNFLVCVINFYYSI